MLRLAGQSDKAVRQLELTYGGGKTHTLITLYHLVRDPLSLPRLPAVDEFIQSIGRQPTKARVAVLPFDKLDVEKGMLIADPAGNKRWLRQPWSVLAYQLAGAEGLRLLNKDGEDEERDTAPAENLLAELLAIPARDDLSTLILIDEVLMYAREKAGIDPTWKDRLANFFQYLTQAAAKTPRCAVVASLLATDPAKSDALGNDILQSLKAVFLREQEQSVQPVGKADVAEVLRRRFFTPESIRDREAFRPHVVAALKGIGDLDATTKKEAAIAESRFLGSYPFHPDLTDIFYTKWTQLDRFQRTRGILRTFALALRDAEAWDDSPLIAANVFLGAPQNPTIADAARELAAAAVREDGAGNRQEWTFILESEQAKAREIQRDMPGLRHREVEQAVLATFLHSQPIGQKAGDRDLYLLLGHTRPDPIELRKGLQAWVDTSWFLDEAAASPPGEGQTGAQRSWRLGSRPNLRQMHDEARKRVEPLVGDRLQTEIGACGSLTSGAQAAGVKVNKLPQSPADVDDDGQFHFVILGPKAASESGKPAAEAVRYLAETTGPDRPRTQRNAILLAVPSREGLEAARQAVRECLGWIEVETMLKSQNAGVAQADPTREALLAKHKSESQKAIAPAVRQAYGVVVTYDEKGQPQAFRLPLSDQPLFNQIKADNRSRIQDTRVEADALLPEGPYDLWRAGDTARRLSHLAGAFASDTHLPKMLNQAAIAETIVDGCLDGAFVLRLSRPDQSFRTFWRQRPDAASLSDAAMEVVLPEAAELTSLDPALLQPGALPGLWLDGSGKAVTGTPSPDSAVAPLSLAAVNAYFAGGTVIQVPRGGFDQAQVVPKAAPTAIEDAMRSAVAAGTLWLTTATAGYCKEELPAGALDPASTLRRPPAPIGYAALLPDNLKDAWPGEVTTVAAIAAALSTQAGSPLPWSLIRRSLGDAFNARVLERTADSREWPGDASDAPYVKVRIPVGAPPIATATSPTPPTTTPATMAPSGEWAAAAPLSAAKIQDLADIIGEVVQATAATPATFSVSITLPAGTPEDVVEQVNAVLRNVSLGLELKR